MLNESLSSDDYSDLSMCEIRSIDESARTPENDNDEYWENFLDETVTVKFKANEEELFTKAFSRRATISDIKRELVDLLQISSGEEVSVEKEGESSINDETMLADLGVAALGIIELNVKTKSAGKLNKNLIYGYIPTLDVITVQIRDGGGVRKTVVVEIEDINVQKPWLGGYRHRITGKFYHHACTQTSATRAADKSGVSRCSRYTQFKPRKEKGTNTMVDKGTHISPHMFSLMSKEDVILSARIRSSDSTETDFNQELYEDELLKVRDHDDSSDEIPPQLSLQLNQSNSLTNQLSEIKDQIEMWKMKELERLKTTDPENINKQRTKILTQSIKFLTRLNEYKSKIRNRPSKAVKILEKYSKPVTLRSSTGATIIVETVLNQKAKTLKELFYKYDRDDAVVDVNEKIDLIHDMIEFFQQNAQNDKYSQDIMALLQEHVELLNNGVNKTESLRSRVRQRILHFLNYAASNSIFDTNNDRADIIAADPHSYYHRRFQPNDFIQITTYQRLLERLQSDEIKQFHTYDSACFTMTTMQFVYLVRDIWSNTSIALDGEDEHQYDLCCCRMTRWNVKESWSPWNCVLLQANQLKLHWGIENAESYYDAALVASVKSKHSMAKLSVIKNEMETLSFI